MIVSKSCKLIALQMKKTMGSMGLLANDYCLCTCVIYKLAGVIIIASIANYYSKRVNRFICSAMMVCALNV